MSKRDHGTRKWFLMNKETGYKCRCQNEITVLGNGF